MTSDSNIIVTTLLAEKGRKFDEDQKCISSYQSSIVFLPADVKPGEIVRVLLGEVTEKKDARGKVMYFARHAPAPVSDDMLRQIRGEAKVLDTMSDFDEETALTLLRARHGMVIDAWKGYRHYYLDESGAVYASVFSPAMLSLFEHLQGGAGATEPLLWILGGTKPAEDSLFCKRDKGEELDWRFSVPPLGDTEIARLQAKAEAGQLLLSDPLIEMRSGALHSEGWMDQLFPRASWPTLPVPNFESGDDVSDIVEHEYGKDLDGQPLLGYAVFGPSEPAWYKQRAEAEEAHQVAVAKLAELRQTWQQRDALRPLIEELNVRRQRLGLSELTCDRDTFKVGWSSYKYTEDNIARFEQETADKEAAEVKTAMEAAMREARERAEAEAAAKTEQEETERQQEYAEASVSGLPSQVEIWKRRGGRTNAGDGWVIRADGEYRDPDEMRCPRPRYQDEGTQVWHQILPGELVIEWLKSSSAADHNFNVIHLPEEGLTEAQQLQVGLILEALESDWKGAIGLASGKPSPGVGDGWLYANGTALFNLDQTDSRDDSVDFEKDRQNQAETGRLGASRSELDALADWFNKGKK